MTSVKVHTPKINPVTPQDRMISSHEVPPAHPATPDQCMLGLYTEDWERPDGSRFRRLWTVLHWPPAKPAYRREDDIDLPRAKIIS